MVELCRINYDYILKLDYLDKINGEQEPYCLTLQL